MLNVAGNAICIFVLDSIFFAETFYKKGDTSDWEILFPKHSAYEMGITEGGKTVFTNPDRALKKEKSDYSDAIQEMREEYHLLPFSKYTYKWYITYCTMLNSENEVVQEQLEGFAQCSYFSRKKLKLMTLVCELQQIGMENLTKIHGCV